MKKEEKERDGQKTPKQDSFSISGGGSSGQGPCRPLGLMPLVHGHLLRDPHTPNKVIPVLGTP